MKWKTSESPDITKWHPYFAFLPTQASDGHTYWLCWIERRADFWWDGIDWFYRPTKENKLLEEK